MTGDWWNKIAGLALTAFAVSLGASFGFDAWAVEHPRRRQIPDEKPKASDPPSPPDPSNDGAFD